MLIKFAFLSFPVIFLMLLFPTVHSSRHQQGRLCHFNGHFDCSPLTRHLLSKINLPPEACVIKDCSQCVKSTRTFLLTDAFELLTPTNFILRHLNDDKDSKSTSYTCSKSDGNFCDCDTNECDGSPDFCLFRNCISDSDCKCILTHQTPQLIAVTNFSTIYNPNTINLEVCLYNKYLRHMPQSFHRQLLEKESASFTNNNLTMSFHDPILHLPATGRVILRSTDFEHVLSVPKDMMVKIPFEFLAYKSTIQVIYLHSNGKTVSGEIHVEGKSICSLRLCFFCTEIFQHLKCFSPLIQYIFYGFLCVITLVFLLCLKMVMKCLIYFTKSFILLLYGIYRLFKFIARCSLLLGAFFGSLMRDIIHNCYQALEAHAHRRANLSSLPLVLLTLSLCVSTSHAECSTHSIIQSDIKTCEVLQDGSKLCNVHTTAELTLPTISSETCLWVSDKNENHLFSLTLKLEDVLCSFQTERMYFTFPVTAKHISQISCIFNRFCGRGVHCKQQSIGKEGLKFEAETPESRQYPGISTCVSGGIGVGCHILTRAACNFRRTWFEPDLLHSYEVSKIRGHTCKYKISVKHAENNTISKLLISDFAYTTSGIRISVLGAYDQPQLHIDDMFIQRVGRPTEGYLAPACQRNHPKAGEIGSIQANISFTKDFIFDPEISKCDFYEDKLRCHTTPDPLLKLRLSQEHALPLQRDIHLFHIQDEKLHSSLLLSSAVRIQLHFTDFKIAVKANTICPHFDDDELSTTGCYRCHMLARIKFKAHSTCQVGVVTVHFQEINVHTKAIRLGIEPTVQIVKFSADAKCYNEKLCLQSASLIQCKTIKFCLDEPTVELMQLNTNYTDIRAVQTSPNWANWFQIPNLNSSLFLLKLIGSGLFILCLIITTLSTLITCCCRSR